MVQQTLVGQVVLVKEASRSHSDTPNLVGLLWKSDQSYAETSTILILARDISSNRFLQLN